MRTLFITFHKGAVLSALLVFAGCTSGPPATFDLLMPSQAGPLKPMESSLVVAEPVASRAVDTDRMIVRGADGAVSYVPGAQWSDRVPSLLQTRLIRAIENKGYSVAREGTGVVGDRILASDMTAFNLVPGTPLKVQLALTMRLIDAREGRILASQSFYAEADVASANGSDVAAGFDAVMSSLLPTIAQWTLVHR